MLAQPLRFLSSVTEGTGGRGAATWAAAAAAACASLAAATRWAAWPRGRWACGAGSSAGTWGANTRRRCQRPGDRGQSRRPPRPRGRLPSPDAAAAGLGRRVACSWRCLAGRWERGAGHVEGACMCAHLQRVVGERASRRRAQRLEPRHRHAACGAGTLRGEAAGAGGWGLCLGAVTRQKWQRGAQLGVSQVRLPTPPSAPSATLPSAPQEPEASLDGTVTAPGVGGAGGGKGDSKQLAKATREACFSGAGRAGPPPIRVSCCATHPEVGGPQRLGALGVGVVVVEVHRVQARHRKARKRIVTAAQQRRAQPAGAVTRVLARRAAVGGRQRHGADADDTPAERHEPCVHGYCEWRPGGHTAGRAATTHGAADELPGDRERSGDRTCPGLEAGPPDLDL